MSGKIIARNRKARHEYDILDTVEAGLVLMGSEIKSIRAGKVNIAEAFVQYREGEMWLLNAHIASYDQASHNGHEPLRARKLLLHKKEIAKLHDQIQIKGMTIVPLDVHLWNGRAKLEIAVARGRKQYDKREALRQKDDKRRMERALKDY